jgi:lipopolysaccharide/colanic/teichoic acid biosynthesis glycosyltransferase
VTGSHTKVLSDRSVAVIGKKVAGTEDLGDRLPKTSNSFGSIPSVDGTPPIWMVRDDWYTTAKSVADYLVGVVLLVLAIPVMIAAGLLARLTSPGPAIYRQTRVSRNGREFSIIKIRSMRVDCERETGPQWSTPDDPRQTPVGGFLRRTHLDELPQLLNIVRGEMSLIGPRPERPEFITKLEKTIPFYRERERVLPGVTGLAQIQLPPDSDVAEVYRKLACDLYYMRHQSLWLDLRIVIGTALKVVGIPTQVLCRLLAIPSGQVIEDDYRRLASLAVSGREPRAAASTAPESSLEWGVAVDAQRALVWGD